MIDPALFDELKTKIEEDTNIRKELDQILDDLNQQVSFTQGVLSRIHSTPRSKCQYCCFSYNFNGFLIDSESDSTLLSQIEGGIQKEIETVGKLSTFASQFPYYKLTSPGPDREGLLHINNTFVDTTTSGPAWFRMPSPPS